MNRRTHVTRAQLSDWLRANGLWSDQTNAALDLAEEVHLAQRRAGGGPYLEEHIYPVTRTVAGYLTSHTIDQAAETILIAILHDTVEDSDTIDLDVIRQRFGPSVASGVDVLTKPEKRPGSGGEETEGAEARYVAGVAAAPWNIRLIKVFDRLNNLAAVHERAPDRRRTYLEETRAYFLDLASSVDPELQHRMTTLLQEQEARFDTETGDAPG